jgi:hypothetical protein
MAINWDVAIFIACSANNPQPEGFTKMLGSAAAIALSLCLLPYCPSRKLTMVCFILNSSKMRLFPEAHKNLIG